MATIDLQRLMDAGVHLGHQTKKWHPKMKEFIYTQKDGYHIIDLVKTQEKLNEAFDFLKNAVGNGKIIVLVGTKRQAASIIEEEAKRAGVSFVNYRWIGGLLTNFESILKTIERYKNYSVRLTGPSFDKLSTRDKFKLKKDFNRLGKLIAGISNLKDRPDILIVVDSGFEKSAVDEAKAAGVPVIALLDTNSDPSKVEIAIPGNDDSVKSIQTVMGALTEAIIEAREDQRSKIKNQSQVQS